MTCGLCTGGGTLDYKNIIKLGDSRGSNTFDRDDVVVVVDVDDTVDSALHTAGAENDRSSEQSLSKFESAISSTCCGGSEMSVPSFVYLAAEVWRYIHKQETSD